MKYNLKNKIIIITGASTGIGLALARKLLDKDAIIVGCARHTENIENLQKIYQDRIWAIRCDVTKDEDLSALIDFTLNKYARIDMVINNAGIGLFEEINNIKFETIRSIFDTNFFSLVNITQKVLPIFETQNEGYFVNIASIAGKTPSVNNSIYTASKHAVIGFSDSIRRELKPKNIHVLVVNPTFVDTEFFKKNPAYLEKFGHHTKIVGFISPELMAEKTLLAIENKQWELTYPFLADLYAKTHQIMPKIAEIFGK